MIKSILVTLDDSDSSKSAKKLGVALAKVHKALLTGIGILDEPWIAAPEAIPLGGVAFKVDLDVQLLQEATHRIHKLEKKFMDYCKSQHITCSIIDATGVPSYEIEHFATAYDMLIIGKDANFHFMLTPETTVSVKQLLTDNPRPVIVTGPHLPFQDSLDVLVAFDGTFASSRALHMAILIGILKGKTVHIASVSSDEEEARDRVNTAAKLCENHGIKPHLHPIARSQKPADALLELISDLHPSLIVMGAFGHSGIRSFFTGSCSKNMLKSTDIPIFVFH
jgi:nucleotide-binding universal stress UspA family protein